MADSDAGYPLLPHYNYGTNVGQRPATPAVTRARVEEEDNLPVQRNVLSEIFNPGRELLSWRDIYRSIKDGVEYKNECIAAHEYLNDLPYTEGDDQTIRERIAQYVARLMEDFDIMESEANEGNLNLANSRELCQTLGQANVEQAEQIVAKNQSIQSHQGTIARLSELVDTTQQEVERQRRRVEERDDAVRKFAEVNAELSKRVAALEEDKLANIIDRALEEESAADEA